MEKPGRTNWEQLAARVGARKRRRGVIGANGQPAEDEEEPAKRVRLEGLQSDQDGDSAERLRRARLHDRSGALGLPTPALALDCEMVEVEGGSSALAEVALVNERLEAVYTSFSRPSLPVTDYRTSVSGVTARALRGAPPLSKVQEAVAELLKGRILVGHALHHDLRALLLTHPGSATRDTARFRPLQRSRGKPRSLRYLASQHLGLEIQVRGHPHSAVEDARASMLLYHRFRRDWEVALRGGHKHKLELRQGPARGDVAHSVKGSGAADLAEFRVLSESDAETASESDAEEDSSGAGGSSSDSDEVAAGAAVVVEEEEEEEGSAGRATMRSQRSYGSGRRAKMGGRARKWAGRPAPRGALGLRGRRGGASTRGRRAGASTRGRRGGASTRRR